jgi:NAD(P)H dehydrogenase (quinone)
MILITGAAGKTGLAIIKALAARGKKSRAFVHREEHKEKVLLAGAREITIGRLEKAEDVKAAMQGAKAIYLIVPNVHPDEIDIAKKAGVDHFVYHSVLYPQLESMPHHWNKMRVEEELIESGLNFTILQPANYMQNVLAFRESVVNDGKMRIPYDLKAKSTPIDLADVAETAATIIGNSVHFGASYQLSGSERLSSHDQAKLVASHSGAKVNAERFKVNEWEKDALAGGLDAGRILTLKKMFSFYDSNDFMGNSKVLEMLLGRPTTLFRDFLKRDWK